MTLVDDMPAKEYFAHPGFGSTSIRTLSDPDISLAEVEYLLGHDEHKPEYDVGTLAHALILEGSLDHLVHRVDAKDWRTKAAKEERDQAYNNDMIPINNSEADSILAPVEAMRDAVMAHPIAKDLLTGHVPEVSLFWETDGVPLKARLDAQHPTRGVVADLKTVRSARPNDVRKQISDLGYYIQSRHYLNGLKEVTGFEPEWYFVTVGKTGPYPVSVHRMTPEALQQGQARIDYALARYKQAQEHGWTGYTAVYEQELTPWERIKNEEMMEETA